MSLQYCVKLNLPVKVDTNFEVYKINNKFHEVVPNEVFGTEFISFLSNMNLEIDWLEIFYLSQNTKHQVHCDSAFLNKDFGKINYVIGGKNSEMIWYDTFNENTGEIKKTKANTTYRLIEFENVKQVFSKNISGFYLVNVGVFHTVKNESEDRYCLSAYIKDKRTNTRLTFTKLKQIFKEFTDESI